MLRFKRLYNEKTVVIRTFDYNSRNTKMALTLPKEIRRRIPDDNEESNNNNNSQKDVVGKNIICIYINEKQPPRNIPFRMGDPPTWYFPLTAYAITVASLFGGSPSRRKTFSFLSPMNIFSLKKNIKKRKEIFEPVTPTVILTLSIPIPKWMTQNSFLSVYRPQRRKNS